MSCSRCHVFGHNARTCQAAAFTPEVLDALAAAPQPPDDTYDPPNDGPMCISCGECHEGDCWGDAPAAFDPRDLGPWADCSVGDPWCPCHGAHA